MEVVESAALSASKISDACYRQLQCRALSPGQAKALNQSGMVDSGAPRPGIARTQIYRLGWNFRYICLQAHGLMKIVLRLRRLR